MIHPLDSTIDDHPMYRLTFISFNQQDEEVFPMIGQTPVFFYIYQLALRPTAIPSPVVICVTNAARDCITNELDWTQQKFKTKSNTIPIHIAITSTAASAYITSTSAP